MFRVVRARLGSWLVFLVLIVAPVLAPRLAHAQPVADEVYADAKEIITELIERDIAESMAANLACYSPGGLLKYFPETLQAAYERNFGALKDVLRQESIKLAGHYAFESFRQRRSIPLREFLPMARFDPSNRDEPCLKEIAALGGPTGYYDQQQSEVRRRNHGQYLPMDVCTVPQGPAAEDLLPCLFAQAVVSSALARRVDAEEALSVAVGTSIGFVLAEYQAGAFDRAALTRTLVEEVRSRFSVGKFPSNGALLPFAGLNLKDSLELAGRGLPTIWREPSADSRVRAGALRMLLAPADSFVATVDDGNALRLLPLTDFLRALPRTLLSALPGEPPSVALARAVLMQASVVPTGVVDVTETDSGVQIKLDAGARPPVAFVGPGLERLSQAYEMAQLANEFHRPLASLGFSAQADPRHEAVLRALVGLVQAIDALGGTLSTAAKTADGGFDLLTLLDSVVRGQFTEGLCAASKPAAPPAPGTTPAMKLSMCALWRQATGLVDPEGNLRPIVSAAREHNYRALAVAAVSAIFSTAATEELCCGKSAACYQSVELYGRLAKSIASYVLMPRDDQDASLAARAAFKSAAVDVIRDIGKRGGVERPFGSALLFPSLSLRASWSGSYRIIDPGKDSIRFVPTVDYPTIRVPLTRSGAPIYVAGVVNLVDPLAPLAELVTRDANFEYSREWWWWAMSAIHPRLSATVAMPSLTKNTALSIGVAMRGSAAFEASRANDDGTRRATFGYRTLFGAKSGDVTFDRHGNLLERLFEVSVGVQYVP